MEETKSPEVLKLEEDLRISKLKNQIDSEKCNTFKNSIISKSLIGIFGIITFIAVTFVSLQIFTLYEIDKTLSPVFSLIAGAFTTYIIFIAGKILKEFTIKGGTMELSAKLQEEIKIVKTEIVETKKDLGEKLSNLQQNIQNIQNTAAHSKVEFNLNTKTGELNEVMEESGITSKELNPKTSIDSEKTKEINKLMKRIEILEEMSGQHTFKNIDELMQRANYHAYAGDYGLAKIKYDEILEKDPKNKNALYNRGYINSRLEKYDLAIRDYKKSLTLEPQNVKALGNLSNAYSKIGNYDESLKCAEKAISIDDKNETAWFNKACALSLLNDKKNAIYALKRAIELEPKNKEHAKKDNDFRNIKNEPEFQKLIES